MEPKPADDLGSLSAAASFPLLVYDHGEKPAGNSQTVLSVADGSTRTYQVPELSKFRCLETPQGLVLLVDTVSLQCSLWNPQTAEKTALPAMDRPLPERCRCIISDTISSPPGYIPDDEAPPDSLVLVYDLRRPEVLFCRVRGGIGWFGQSTGRAIGPIAAVQGIFYFIKSTGVVGAYCSFADDPEPSLKLATFYAPEPTFATDVQMYLLESSGELFLVCLFYLGSALEHARAYVMDFDQFRWRRMTDDIGDRAFLLGPSSFAASCPAAEHGLKEGCVYFLGDSNEFYIFDLKEDSRELAGPTQDIPALSRKPFWLVPIHPGVK
jgi:hypothetical protein